MPRGRKGTTVTMLNERTNGIDETTASDAPVSENDDDDDESDHSEKAKRERVNLETLPADARVTLGIVMPAAMKLAILKVAEAQGINASTYGRNKLAEIIEFAVPASFSKRTRTSKYASKEEQKAANAQKQKQGRETLAAVMAAAAAGELDLSTLLSQYGKK